MTPRRAKPRNPERSDSPVRSERLVTSRRAKKPERLDWKAEGIRQWDADPCGADWVSQFASPEFFTRVEQERYGTYAPWLKDAIGFERYKGKRVLEVGFGLGTDLMSFARAGAECFGIDLTPAHVAATSRRLRLGTLPVRLGLADAELLPFKSNSFDAVYSFGVLHHTPDTQRAIHEIHRVLQPGGEAVVGLYHRDSLFFWCSCVLIGGILRGGFFREGYRKTLSRIERREHSDAIPLVKVYSRRGARRLFSYFQSVQIRANHLELAHAGRLAAALQTLLKTHSRAVSCLLSRHVGWYLIIHARKCAAA